jgi:drug/metabolite transporter (DMT)-like permease
MTARSPVGPLPRNLKGALWMVGSGVSFTLMISLIKQLSAYSPPQIMFFSQAIVALGLLPAVVRHPRVLVPRQFSILMLRAMTTVGGMWLSYISVQSLPLADANALSFTRVLWMVALASLFFGEALTALRVLTLVAGFAGVVLVADPTGGVSLGWGHVAGVGSALLLALSILTIKILGKHHGTLGQLVWGAWMGMVLSFPLAVSHWQWPPLHDLALIAVLGLSSIVTQTCYIKGMIIGDTTAMAPIDYLRLVFAILTGIVFFNEFPTVWTFAGGGLIVASTLSVTLWEASRERRAMAAAAAAQDTDAADGGNGGAT